MRRGNFLWVALGTFAVGLGVLVGGFVRTGRAQVREPGTVTCRADFPVIGLSGREMALVHAAWVEGDGDPVNLKVQFIDRTGQVLDESTQALAPNETVSAKLDPPGRLEKSERLEFRAVVFVEPGAGGPGFPAESGCPQVITSLERTTARGDAILVVSPACAIGRMCLRPGATPSPEVSPPTDVAFPPDVMVPVDLAHPPDVFLPVDLAHPPDVFLPVDLTAPPPDVFLPVDLVHPPDLFLPPDLVPPPPS